MRARLCLTTVACAVVLSLPAPARAQVFGTFTWQMQPFCNRVTITLSNTPAGFTLDGADDQCGISRGSVFGVAVFTPTGTVALNFTIVSAPGGEGAHVSGMVDPGTGSGSWTDSAGHTGTFVLGGVTPGLPVRPTTVSTTIGVGAVSTTALADLAVTTPKLADVAVTTPKLADGAVSAAKIAAAAVDASKVNAAQVQLRVAGTCPTGELMIGVNANGTVTCAAPTQAASNLECTQAALTNFEVPAGTSNYYTNAACPTGYVATMPYCYTYALGVFSQGSGTVVNIVGNPTFCAWQNTTASAQTVFGGSVCCRVPAR